MKRQDVTSREYKVMLLPDRFPGAEEEARPQVDRFWTDVGRLLEPLDIPTYGAFDRVKAHRRIRFVDIPQLIERAVEAEGAGAITSIEDCIEVDARTRRRVDDWLGRAGGVSQWK